MLATLELLRRTEAHAFWAELGPGLHVEGTAPIAPPAPDDTSERRWLREEGLVQLPGAAARPVAAAVTEAVGRLVALGLPATFVYAYDEVWEIGARLGSRLEALLERPLVMLDDFWAFHVPAGHGRGWPPHRGNPYGLLDREHPEHLDAWIAMTDVPAERGALGFVPLDDDPGYPGDLERLDAPLAHARALPVTAGTALAWNGNVLHWGGACSARAAGPRVSVTFTYALASEARRLGFAPLSPPSTLAGRREAIARQLACYGEGQPDVTDQVRQWALTDSMLVRRLRSPE